MSWTWRERVLLLLAIAGFVIPNTMVAVFMFDLGRMDWIEYFSHWGESLPATQLAFDVSIVFAAFALWALFDGRRVGLSAWWVIPASVFVGICFACPLYLLLRERRLRALSEADPDVPKSGHQPTEVEPASAV